MITTFRYNDLESLRKVFADNPGEIACILLDVTMPHMDGYQTLSAIRRIDSKVPVLFASGYTEYDVTARVAGKGLSAFVQKPFSLDDLAKSLRQAICGESEPD